MSRVIIVGCGIIGATLAYELSHIPELKITVLEQKQPAEASTGAALGVLMGVISQKLKGKNWQLRETSIRRYETLIPELEAQIGQKIPFNRQGILMLCQEGEELANWEKLRATRQSQGWQLEIWHPDRIRDRCPQLNLQHVIAAIYSPQDRQLDPTALTLALVKAARQNGVIFEWNATVNSIQSDRTHSQLQTTIGTLDCDWLIIAAGLGSSALTASLQQFIDIRPVLGQALHLRLEQPLGNPDFQPSIAGDDIHIVPCTHTSPVTEYWVGATVEFPTDAEELVADSHQLKQVMEKAIAFCPALATATLLRQWSGLRPRPEGQPAPIIKQLPDYDRIFIASGHYRNGILLAPATAQLIRDAIASQVQ